MFKNNFILRAFIFTAIYNLERGEVINFLY
jgi:hypothetical protein